MPGDGQRSARPPTQKQMPPHDNDAPAAMTSGAQPGNETGEQAQVEEFSERGLGVAAKE